MCSRRSVQLTVVAKHLPHILTRLSDVWHPASFDAMHTGVVRSQRERKIPLIEVQQVAELPGTAADVFDGIIHIGHPQGCCRVGRQLHEPDGSPLRDDMLTKIRLGLDYGMQQRGIKTVTFRIKGDCPSNVLLRVVQAIFGIGNRRDRSQDDHQHGEKANAAAASCASKDRVFPPVHPS